MRAPKQTTSKPPLVRKLQIHQVRAHKKTQTPTTIAEAAASCDVCGQKPMKAENNVNDYFPNTAPLPPFF